MSLRRYRRLALIAALFLAAVAWSQDLALTAGTFAFPNSGSWASPFAGAGTYAQAGFIHGVTPEIEAGTSVIARLTPEPLDELIVEEHLGISLFGARVSRKGMPALYINALLDLGLAFGFENVFSGDSLQSRYLFARFTPLALGNSYYGRRDRMFSLGLLYDFEKQSPSFFLSIIASDFFIASPRKTP